MNWSWLLTSKIGQMIGATASALALFFGVVIQQRHDARKKALRQVKEKDQKNANAIRDRVDRADDSLHKYDGRGFRD
jgi:3-methyladenine DNA glycosylase AlkD